MDDSSPRDYDTTLDYLIDWHRSEIETAKHQLAHGIMSSMADVQYQRGIIVANLASIERLSELHREMFEEEPED